VLEGSVRRSGDKVRITAQLVRASDASTIWSQSFERSLSDVFAVQEEIGRAVVEALQVRLLPGKTVARGGGTTNAEALQLYMVGRDSLRSGGKEALEALAAFEKAVVVDPRFALAWVGIANAVVSYEATEGDPRGVESRRSRALAAANRAVELAPSLPDASLARAAVNLWLENDWRGARSDVERAHTLAPGDPAVALTYGFYLLATGDLDRAIGEFERATSLDPRVMQGWMNGWLALGTGLVSKGDHERGRAAFRKALEVFPGFEEPRWGLGMDFIAAGEPEAALAEASRIKENPGYRLDMEALAHHDLGHFEQARAALAEDVRLYAGVGAYQIAEVHAWWGDLDGAFAWLERARVQRDTAMFWVKTDPLLRKIRGDPRWPVLLERAGLPPDAAGKDAAVPVAAPPPAAAPSIAVLPFADMSPKHDQEYLADGVAEEIRNALAKVRRLRVIGRTSSFSFKGRNEDLRTIGQKLGAGHLLEGSVRKAGTRVRITAQLVEARGGTHVWSETFDRKLTDVFAVQQEIAQSVATALQASLVPAGANRTTTPEAYDQYLRGRRFLDSGGPEGIRAAVAAFQRAVALDPGYAPAHVRLSEAYGSAAGYLADTPDEVMRDARLAVASADRRSRSTRRARTDTPRAPAPGSPTSGTGGEDSRTWREQRPSGRETRAPTPSMR
jgi:TolB-like protein/Flp pilus assembly protein TadD